MKKLTYIQPHVMVEMHLSNLPIMQLILTSDSGIEPGNTAPGRQRTPVF